MVQLWLPPPVSLPLPTLPPCCGIPGVPSRTEEGTAIAFSSAFLEDLKARCLSFVAPRTNPQHEFEDGGVANHLSGVRSCSDAL